MLWFPALQAHRTTQVQNGSVTASIAGSGWDLDSQHCEANNCSAFHSKEFVQLAKLLKSGVTPIGVILCQPRVKRNEAQRRFA